MADVGLILEYAALLCDKERAAAPDLRYTLCLQHVARIAQRRLADFCELGWPALTAQVCYLPPPTHKVLEVQVCWRARRWFYPDHATPFLGWDISDSHTHETQC